MGKETRIRHVYKTGARWESKKTRSLLGGLGGSPRFRSGTRFRTGLQQPYKGTVDGELTQGSRKIHNTNK